MNATINYLMKLGYGPTDYSSVVHESGTGQQIPDAPQNAGSAGPGDLPRQGTPHGGAQRKDGTTSLNANREPDAAITQPKDNQDLKTAGATFRARIQAALK